MSTQLLEIQPRQLEFVFELKKQSSCAVRLVNMTDSLVAFKIKTTSPKKYSVRPNIGIVQPRSTSYFKVTMQAQRIVPPNLRCRDKFLVQSIVVPEGTNDDDVVPGLFSKDDSKYVEEVKLRVVLVSPPNSPLLSPMNGVHGDEVPVVKDRVFDNTETIDQEKIESVEDISQGSGDSNEDLTLPKGKMTEHVSIEDNEIVKEVAVPYKNNSEDVNTLKKHTYENTTHLEDETAHLEDETAESISSTSRAKVPEDELEYKMETCEESGAAKSARPGIVRSIEDIELIKAIEKMKSKIHEVELKLTKAELMISSLTDEKRSSTQDLEALRKELVTLKFRSSTREVQFGFPLIFVGLAALAGIVLGYLVRC